MYAMTAAHPTLPIPSYARVTSLDNGKSVVVRINDRGPFHSKRIIDLSYTAAHKLGYLGQRQRPGAGGKPRSRLPTTRRAKRCREGIYLQVGAFSQRRQRAATAGAPDARAGTRCQPVPRGAQRRAASRAARAVCQRRRGAGGSRAGAGTSRPECSPGQTRLIKRLVMKLFCVGAGAAAVPASAWAAPSGMTARAWVVIDQASGRELAAHQADLPLAPASLTQLMTAYVLLGDIRKNKLSLGEMLSVPEAATQADGARVFLKAGEQVSVDTLLQAMLVQSASDATLTLVTATDGSEAAFVERMNREAKRLGMTQNPFHECHRPDRAGARIECARSGPAGAGAGARFSRSAGIFHAEGTGLQGHHVLQRQSPAVARQHGERAESRAHHRGRLLHGGVGAARRPAPHRGGAGRAIGCAAHPGCAETC